MTNHRATVNFSNNYIAKMIVTEKLKVITTLKTVGVGNTTLSYQVLVNHNGNFR